MDDSAATLRRRLAQVGRIKQDSADEDTRRHLELDLGARLLATIRHADALLRARPWNGDILDQEVEVWARVRRRLAESA